MKVKYIRKELPDDTTINAVALPVSSTIFVIDMPCSASVKPTLREIVPGLALLNPKKLTAEQCVEAGIVALGVCITLKAKVAGNYDINFVTIRSGGEDYHACYVSRTD